MPWPQETMNSQFKGATEESGHMRQSGSHVGFKTQHLSKWKDKQSPFILSLFSLLSLISSSFHASFQPSFFPFNQHPSQSTFGFLHLFNPFFATLSNCFSVFFVLHTPPFLLPSRRSGRLLSDSRLSGDCGRSSTASACWISLSSWHTCLHRRINTHTAKHNRWNGKERDRWQLDKRHISHPCMSLWASAPF